MTAQEIGVQLKNDLEIRIAKVFSVFDVHSDNFIDTRNIGNVLRILGCAPTEKEVHEIMLATESAEEPGETHLSKFIAHITKLLMDEAMKPASSDEILDAFKVLDPENKLYLTKEYFGKLMSEDGEPFNEEEMADMWAVAIDPITDNIPYEFYINQLKHKTDLYDMAYQVKDQIARAEKDRRRPDRMRSRTHFAN
ncbi:dynein regulatory complex protein 8-like [Scaptodrosophila lebanonensis]|uniref:Dynein regulatory complex protein 8-like n=1 Tax=Drosophila lebanonensis TaxID=7225 RepID=A0A6J2TTN4_DROLE|nr:dynein regulatory complex protein 8-like [Scaptodrosophila lebanonensis]